MSCMVRYLGYSLAHFHFVVEHQRNEWLRLEDMLMRNDVIDRIIPSLKKDEIFFDMNEIDTTLYNSSP